MKILTVCYFGQVRSVFLKDYLKEKGYDADSVGVSQDRAKLYQKVSDADVIISVSSDIEKKLRELANLEDKKIITLNVSDGSKYSHDALAEQINKYLPIKE